MQPKLVQRKQKFFALRKFLVDEESKGTWTFPDFSPPPVLLAQISEVDRDVISQLERVGIHDTNDLMSAGEDVLDHVQISRHDHSLLLDSVEQYLGSKQDIPRVLLELPRNYLVLSIVTTQQMNAMAILWRGILFSWACPAAEGWHLIKFPFDHYFDKMKRPELIGSYGHVGDVPTWLDSLTDLSTYLSGIFPGENLEDRAIQWGFPEKSFDHPMDQAEYNVLQISYIIDIALQFHQQLDQLS